MTTIFLGTACAWWSGAEKGLDAFIGEHVNVTIEDTGKNGRRLTFNADSPRYAEMLNALEEHAAVGADEPECQATTDGTQ